MRVYEVNFFKVNRGATYYYVYHSDNTKFLNLGNKDTLIIKETDLDEIKEYGGGIKSINHIGELFEQPNSKVELNKNITIITNEWPWSKVTFSKEFYQQIADELRKLGCKID